MTGAATYDEAFSISGEPRDGYATLLGAFDAIGLETLAGRSTAALTGLRASFRGGPLPMDPIPRLLPEHEYAQLAAGVSQRVRALNEFILDVYGEQRIVSAGRLDPRIITEAAGFEPALRGCWPAGAVPVGVAGFDIVRAETGRFMVLEDNVRAPSGFGYGIAVRALLSKAIPELQTALQPAASVSLGQLAQVLLRAAPAAGPAPVVVLLSDGPGARLWYEHARIGRELGVPVVALADLRRRGDEVHMTLPGGATRRVDVVYRRHGDEGLRSDDGSLSDAAELLLEPWLAGGVALVNAFGTGVADDKLLHAHVEEMICFYLGEEPLLPSVPTLDLRREDHAERVLADLSHHVIKPRAGEGGRGVVIGATASSRELRHAVQSVRSDPGGHVAQPLVAFSTHPTLTASGLAPRHVDLRLLSCSTAEGMLPRPSALTRYASPDDALVVNFSRGGGVKDTWILS